MKKGGFEKADCIQALQNRVVLNCIMNVYAVPLLQLSLRCDVAEAVSACVFV
jgi:hypothetical protein